MTLDGATVPNPFTGSFARDALEHRLQVTRDGFVSEGRLLRFDGDDLDLALTLSALPEPRASARPSTSAPGPAPAPRPRLPPRPHLDADPYR